MACCSGMICDFLGWCFSIDLSIISCSNTQRKMSLVKRPLSPTFGSNVPPSLSSLLTSLVVFRWFLHDLRGNFCQNSVKAFEEFLAAPIWKYFFISVWIYCTVASGPVLKVHRFVTQAKLVNFVTRATSTFSVTFYVDSACYSPWCAKHNINRITRNTTSSRWRYSQPKNRVDTLSKSSKQRSTSGVRNCGLRVLRYSFCTGQGARRECFSRWKGDPGVTKSSS